MFMFSVNNNSREYMSTNLFAVVMHWLKPFGLIAAIILLIYYGAKVRGEKIICLPQSPL